MYDNDFTYTYHPDGLTEAVIDQLIAEAFGPQQPVRRKRRDTKRTLGATVRALRVSPVLPIQTGNEAA